jgi:hypothetical protein
VALYIPATARRRRSIAITVAALVLGLIAGLLIGRTTAPTATDRIHSIQEDARRTAAGLRVLSLHEQAGAVSDQAPGNGGAALVLTRTRSELSDETDRAPWITPQARRALLDQLAKLAARTDRNAAGFGDAADALAGRIEEVFGVKPG